MLLLVRGCETNGFTNSLLVCTYMLAFQLCAWPSDILSSAMYNIALTAFSLNVKPRFGFCVGVRNNAFATISWIFLNFFIHRVGNKIYISS